MSELPATRAEMREHGLLLGRFCAWENPALFETLAAQLPTLSEDRSLYLLAAYGSGLWDLMLSQDPQALSKKDPIDQFSARLARHLAESVLDDPLATLLYPSTWPVPLMAMGRALGWSHDSPLGLGLHPQFGPWLAYRAAWFGTRAAASLTAMDSDAYPHSSSPCIGCVDSPCVSACPAEAVVISQHFSVTRCHSYRAAPNSDCRLDCAARRACPVGAETAYRPEQLQWHMGKMMISSRKS